VLDDERMELFCGFLLIPSCQADVVCHNTKAGKVFFIFFPPASVWLRRDMIDDDKNWSVAAIMSLPLALQVVRSGPYLCRKVLHADDSETDRNTRKLERGSSIVVEPWDVIESDWDGLEGIPELDAIGSHLFRAP